ncbi:MAG TPA: flagellar hook-basal body complex protein FliE [Gemmatimonadaceae bacterium]|nr:flagellar hook-basal body complex protein FliE [Gemmatimonadaceae bacterium]
MTAPIGGLGGIGGAGGVGARRPLGLEIAGELSPRGGIGAPSVDGPSFGDTLERALGQVSDASETAKDYVQRFVRGEQVELHQVMAATEEAGIALEMLVEIRNKFTEAYRAVISMQA